MNTIGRSGNSQVSIRTADRRFKLAPLAHAIALTLAAGAAFGNAHAQQAFSRGWFNAKGAVQSGAAATGLLPNGKPVSSLTNLQPSQDNAQVRRSIENLSLAARGIAAQQAAQEAARQAALNGASDIPDGLAEGGLKVDTNSLTAGWFNAKAPTQSNAGGTTQVTVEQTAEKAILNWESFNVGKNTLLRFDQRGGGKADGSNSWIAFNRINDPSGRPSRIAGQIDADGAVYIVNRNGIIFHGGSQVNTRTLVASTLALSDDQFKAGINNAKVVSHIWAGDALMPVFGDHAPGTLTFDEADDWKPTEAVPGAVRVEAGARLDVTNGGKLMLLGTQVSNAGALNVKDGQVILAAGEQVWLTEDQHGVRGLDVAVSGPLPSLMLYSNIVQIMAGSPQGGSFGVFDDRMRSVVFPALEARAAALDYNVTNSGSINAERGNITLQSREINQDGVLTASTALNNRDGSIRLRAWGQGQLFNSPVAFENAAATQAVHWSAGTLTLGKGSVAMILPDAGDTSLIETTDLATRYTPGSITLHGKLVDLQSGSLLMAPSGVINIVSAASPYQPGPNPSAGPALEPGYGAVPQDGSRIYIDSGAVVSVAGLQEVAVAMSRNFIEVDLRINELRDSPLLRDSWLRGMKLVVDRRESGLFENGPMAGVLWGGDAGAWLGTPLADVSGWIGVGKTDLQELSTTGGTINFKSGGSLVTRAGSLLDVSGGSVKYQGGLNTASKLLGADGRIYTMANATPDMLYTGIAGQYSRDHARWGVKETFTSPLIGRANFESGYVEGRNAGQIQMYVSEGLVLEGDIAGGVVAGERQRSGGDTAHGGRWVVGGGSNEQRAWLPGHVMISDAPEKLAADFTADSLLDERFERDGLVDTTSWIGAGLLEESGLGEISLYVGKGFTLAEGTELALAPKSTLRVNANANSGADVVFRVDGSIRSAGGAVALTNLDGGSVVLGDGARIDVGGHWTNELMDGPAFGVRTVDGGTIGFNASKVTLEGQASLVVSGGGRVWLDKGKRRLAMGDAGSISLIGVDGADIARLDLQAFAAGSGGQLELVLNGAVQAGGDPAAQPGVLQLPADLYGDRGFRALKVDTAGRIDIADGAQLNLTPLGWDMTGVDYAAIGSDSRLGDLLAPVLLRPEQRLEHEAVALNLGTRPGGALRLGRDASIRVDTGGAVVLSAPDISLFGTIEAPAGSIDASGATLALGDTARLLARGAAVIYTTAQGMRSGMVLDGGSVTLKGSDVTLPAGALIDVSGASGEIDGVGGGLFGRGMVAHSVASNGGSIAITGQGLIEATLVGQPGGAGAHGGTLSIEHVAPPSGSNLADVVLAAICKAGGSKYCTPSAIIGFDFSQFVKPRPSPMIITRELFDYLANASKVALLVSDAPTGGGDAPAGIDYASFGLNDSALNGFKSLIKMDLRTLVASGSTLLVRPASFAQGGFANLALATKGAVELGAVQLAATRSITIDGALRSAAAERGDASLAAPYIALRGAGTTPAAVADRAGRLVLDADVIDVRGGANSAGTLYGAASIRGFAQTVLNASELRFSVANYAGDGRSPGVADATLNVDGALTIAAGQVYPATAVNARILSGESITVLGNGATPAAPLSAGGSLTLSAPLIEQYGVLRAPFGQIVLDAGDRLVLGAGSLTSVSGAGLLVPYGSLLNNEYWAAPFMSSDSSGLALLPDKRVTLDAPVVDYAAGAVIDIRGGGDMVAREFVPGTGGSHDITALPGAYAIMPGQGSPVAPGGSDTAAGAVGSSIWLAGGNGLAAGWYTLLPARYAALPGAYLVMPSGGAASLNAPVRATALADGSMVMAGRQGNALDGSGAAKTSYWNVMSSTRLRQYSEYNEAGANGFFASDAFKLTQYRLTGVDIVTPRLPDDGGSVVFKAGQRLVLDGQLLSQAANGGRGGLVDIAGQKIAIVGQGQDGSDLQAAGYLLVDAGNLSRFGAGSLLVGGVRSANALGLGLEVTASDIVVRNGADTALFGPEIILAGTDRVAIEEGSVVSAKGAVAGGAGNLVMQAQVAAVYVDPDGKLDDNNDGFVDAKDALDDLLVTPSQDWGALLRVSNGDAVKVIRQNVDITHGGLVSIGADALVEGGAALLIDATGTTELAASARISGAALSVAAGRIGLGGGSEGLVLGAASLAQLSNAQEVTLRSYSSIDFHDDVDFRGAGLNRVVLDTARLAGYNGNVTVQAASLTLANSGAQAAPGAAAGSGSLRLAADELVLDSGAKAIEGFATIELVGRNRILALGSGSLDAGAGNLTLDSAVLTGGQGASQRIATSGALTLSGDSAAAPAGLEDSLGASLAFIGGTVRVDGHIAALGGTVALTATAGDLVIDDGARIDVGGFARDFYDVAAYANAGRIELVADQGSIRSVRGSLLNLAAHADGGDAGTLMVRTAGNGGIGLDGGMRAQAGAGGAGGSFAMDSANLADFGALARQLNDAGFSAARNFRVRNGDVTIDGATTVADFTLSADRGSVTLAGAIDARSTYGGRIQVAAGNGVTMTGAALLQAGATDAVLGSGRVVLEAGGGQLDLRGGTIDVGGGEGGRVRLRAQQNASHDDINVAALDVTITGARSAVLEGVSSYNVGDYDGATVDSVKADAILHANTFSGAAPGIAARLGTSLAIMPGIEIQSDGDLAMNSDWNLYGSFGANLREGALTLRAAGNLVLNGHLSDGFDAAGRDGVLQDTASWDLRLVAGADLASASALSLQAPGALAAGSGSLIVGSAAAGYLVRTGTGDLDVSVGRNLDLAHHESVIYTAGRADTTVWSDFTTVPGQLAQVGHPAAPSAIVINALATAAYGIEGGNLSVHAQGDVSSALGAGGTAQFFNEWLLRLGRKEGLGSSGAVVTHDMPFQPGEQATWFVDYAKFNQGIGALGGGNVTLNAGGDINDLLVALPTNGRVRGGRTEGETKTLELRNGGALNVMAEGAIRGGQYYIGRGNGQLRAAELAPGQRAGALAPVLAIGDATLGVTTRGDLAVATVADPLMTKVHYAASQMYDNSAYAIGAYMSGYTDTSALDLVSIGGDVTLGAAAPYAEGQDYYPAKLRVAALSGSISNETGAYGQSDDQFYNVARTGLLFMMPAAHTELRLLAEQDVRLGQVVQARLAPEALPQPFNPVRDYADQFRLWLVNNTLDVRSMPQGWDTPTDWLADDRTPSRIYARSGSLVRDVSGEVIAGEQMWLRAGADIRGLRLNLRNNHADDVSRVEAGNDVSGLTSNPFAMRNSVANITIQGPGSLLVAAGRDVYNVNATSLGNIQRWDTDNFPDPLSRVNHLSEEGASISVMAGLGKQQPDYAAFQDAYLDPARVGAMAAHLVATLDDGSNAPLYLVDGAGRRGLVSYIAEVSGETLPPLQAWARFQALPGPAREVFLRRVFQQELREAGRDQNQPGAGGLPRNGGYNRGYDAIGKLFPGNAWDGDVVADSMTLRTMQGGDINVFAPGGKLQVASLTSSPAAGEGLVTLGGGHIGIFTDDSVVVNRSRILAFVPQASARGSDMIIWSSNGDVDAGRGAKTVRVPSRPIVDTDLNANTTVTERSDMSGSGIGTVGDGDVDLVAPKGTINAGDAGIRVAGNLNLAALHVVNIDNIEVEGEATGLPVIAAINIGALTNASAAASQATAAAQDVMQRERSAARQALPSIFTVRVLGFGNEPADGDKAPSPASSGLQSRGMPYDAAKPLQLVGVGRDFDPRQLARMTDEERRHLQQDR